ncbi:hypothetical protein D6D02_09774 [Aureobasidium pullulans]|nr:hypothetical protein D6D02_09774 [Aureobasidium pullulans]THY07509.1 hypothetical protein D6D03_01607 [Aureobasidium pullulans]THZ22863.1 hypothetical protein D6C89_05851 [Aureobasidium pullulans]
MSELAFCSHLLAKYEDFWLKSKAPYVGPFLRPVDEVRDNAPGYYGRIRQPMDLATMRTKLEGGRYNSAADFKADFDLMISNCYEYNTAGPASLTDLAERFVKDFDWEWEQMARWRSKERSRLLKLHNVSVADSSAAERSSRPSPELGSPSALGNDLVVPSSVLSSPARSSKRARQIAEEDSETDESPKRARVDQSSEDAVDAVVVALRQIMAQEIEALTAEQDALMEAQVGPHWALWDKVWGPDRHEIFLEMWHGLAFANITDDEWPNSQAAIRSLVLAAWNVTFETQMQFVYEEEANEAQRVEAEKEEARAEMLRRMRS